MFMPCWGLCVMSSKAAQFTLPVPVLMQVLLSNLENYEHLKYVWIVYCVITNQKRDRENTETKENGWNPYITMNLVFGFHLLSQKYTLSLYITECLNSCCSLVFESHIQNLV